jgi:hypothetical protein|tara:strand:+ start:3142 stop:3261 length:120 start_codon:yes stop_codon:yes gene_type:complete
LEFAIGSHKCGGKKNEERYEDNEIIQKAEEPILELDEEE